MATLLIEGDKISSEGDLHRVLTAALDFGPFYGRNLDALWDRLSRDVERPVEIIWTNAAQSRRSMGDELFSKIVALLRAVEADDVKSGYADRLTVVIYD
jgi:ribonuclease inhibitor